MSANRSRKHKVTLYLSDNEYTLLKAKTKAAKMRSMSQTLRYLLINAFVYDVDYRYILEYNTLLAKIGNNLNQITKYVNTSQDVTMEQFQEIKNIMKKVMNLQLQFIKSQPSPPQAEIDEFNSKPLTPKTKVD